MTNFMMPLFAEVAKTAKKAEPDANTYVFYGILVFLGVWLFFWLFRGVTGSGSGSDSSSSDMTTDLGNRYD